MTDEQKTASTDRLREYATRQWEDETYRMHMKTALRAYNGRPEVRERKQAEMRSRWGDPDYVKNFIGKAHASPNKVEAKLFELINSLCPNEWRFVGDGSLVVGTKCPDFVNDSKNLLIELFGDYWHQGENPSDKINYFRGFGYETLVIWESEFYKDPEALSETIKLFNNRVVLD